MFRLSSWLPLLVVVFIVILLSSSSSSLCSAANTCDPDGTTGKDKFSRRGGSPTQLMTLGDGTSVYTIDASGGKCNVVLVNVKAAKGILINSVSGDTNVSITGLTCDTNAGVGGSIPVPCVKFGAMTQFRGTITIDDVTVIVPKCGEATSPSCGRVRGVEFGGAVEGGRPSAPAGAISISGVQMRLPSSGAYATTSAVAFYAVYVAPGRTLSDLDSFQVRRSGITIDSTSLLDGKLQLAIVAMPNGGKLERVRAVTIQDNFISGGTLAHAASSPGGEVVVARDVGLVDVETVVLSGNVISIDLDARSRVVVYLAGWSTQSELSRIGSGGLLARNNEITLRRRRDVTPIPLSSSLIARILSIAPTVVGCAGNVTVASSSITVQKIQFGSLSSLDAQLLSINNAADFSSGGSVVVRGSALRLEEIFSNAGYVVAYMVYGFSRQADDTPGFLRNFSGGGGIIAENNVITSAVAFLPSDGTSTGRYYSSHYAACGVYLQHLTLTDVGFLHSHGNKIESAVTGKISVFIRTLYLTKMSTPPRPTCTGLGDIAASGNSLSLTQWAATSGGAVAARPLLDVMVHVMDFEFNVSAGRSITASHNSIVCRDMTTTVNLQITLIYFGADMHVLQVGISIGALHNTVTVDSVNVSLGGAGVLAAEMIVVYTRGPIAVADSIFSWSNIIVFGATVESAVTARISNGPFFGGGFSASLDVREVSCLDSVTVLEPGGAYTTGRGGSGAYIQLMTFRPMSSVRIADRIIITGYRLRVGGSKGSDEPVRFFGDAISEFIAFFEDPGRAEHPLPLFVMRNISCFWGSVSASKVSIWGMKPNHGRVGVNAFHISEIEFFDVNFSLVAPQQQQQLSSGTAIGGVDVSLLRGGRSKRVAGLPGETEPRMLVFNGIQRLSARRCNIEIVVWATGEIHDSFFEFSNRVNGDNSTAAGAGVIEISDSSLYISQSRDAPSPPSPQFPASATCPKRSMHGGINFYGPVSDINVDISRFNVSIGTYVACFQLDAALVFFGTSSNDIADVALDAVNLLMTQSHLLVGHVSVNGVPGTAKSTKFSLVSCWQHAQDRSRYWRMISSGVSATTIECHNDGSKVTLLDFRGTASVAGGPLSTVGNPDIDLIFDSLYVHVVGGVRFAKDSIFRIMSFASTAAVSGLVTPQGLRFTSCHVSVMLPMGGNIISQDASLQVAMVDFKTMQNVAGGMHFDQCTVTVASSATQSSDDPFFIINGITAAMLISQSVIGGVPLFSATDCSIKISRCRVWSGLFLVSILGFQYTSVLESITVAGSSVEVSDIHYTQAGSNPLLSRVGVGAVIIVSPVPLVVSVNSIEISTTTVRVVDCRIPRRLELFYASLAGTSVTGTVTFRKSIEIRSSSVVVARIAVDNDAASGANSGYPFARPLVAPLIIATPKVDNGVVAFSIVVDRTSVEYAGFPENYAKLPREQRQLTVRLGFLVFEDQDAASTTSSSPLLPATLSVSSASISALTHGRDDAKLLVAGVMLAPRLASAIFTQVLINVTSARRTSNSDAEVASLSVVRDSAFVAVVLRDVRLLARGSSPLNEALLVNVSSHSGFVNYTIQNSRVVVSGARVAALVFVSSPVASSSSSSATGSIFLSNNDFSFEESLSQQQQQEGATVISAVPIVVLDARLKLIQLRQERYDTPPDQSIFVVAFRRSGSSSLPTTAAAAAIDTIEFVGRCSFLNEQRLNRDVSMKSLLAQGLLRSLQPADSFFSASRASSSTSVANHLVTDRSTCATYTLSLSRNTKSPTRSNFTSVDFVTFHPKTVLPELFAGAAALSTLSAVFAPASYSLALRVLSMAQLTQCPNADPMEIPPRDFTSGNVLDLRISEPILATHRGAVVSAIIVIFVVSGAAAVLVLMAVSWWMTRKQQQQNHLQPRRAAAAPSSSSSSQQSFLARRRLEKAARKLAFPTSFVFGACFILTPTTADAASTLVAVHLAGAADLVLGVAGFLLCCVGPMGVLVWMCRRADAEGRLLVEEPKPFGGGGGGGDDAAAQNRRGGRSGQSHRKQQQQQRQQQHKKEEEASSSSASGSLLPLPLALLVSCWVWLSEQWKNWQSTRFIDLTCCSTTYDGYSLPYCAVLDFAVTIMLTLVSGVANGCSDQRCCTASAGIVLAIAVCYFVALVMLRPYCTRFDILFSYCGGALTVVAACLLVAIVASGGDASGAVSGFALVGEVSQVIGFIGIVQCCLIPGCIYAVDFVTSAFRESEKRAQENRQRLLDEADQEMETHRFSFSAAMLEEGGSRSSRSRDNGPGAAGRQQQQHQQRRAWRLKEEEEDQPRRPHRQQQQQQQERDDDGGDDAAAVISDLLLQQRMRSRAGRLPQHQRGQASSPPSPPTHHQHCRDGRFSPRDDYDGDVAAPLGRRRPGSSSPPPPPHQHRGASQQQSRRAAERRRADPRERML